MSRTEATGPTAREGKASTETIRGSEQRSYVGHNLPNVSKYVSSLTTIIRKIEMQKQEKLQEALIATGS